MEEIQELHTALNPHHILLVVDAMMGQDTVRMASSFGESVPLTGLILTRLDGDARGGAALSIREVTGCPIQFIGIGEKVDQLEAFQASRLAGRILDMGDVVSLVEKTSEMISQEDAQAMASKMQKGTFDMDDLAAQLMQLSKMGGMGSLLSMMPGMGKLKSQLPNGVLDDGILKRQLAIIRSMTRAEKKNVKLLNASRRQRIAQGSGTSVQDINRLIKNYTQMADMMKKMSRIGSKGLMRGGLQRLLQK
jgi:signal recognition particle subunit SRP54